MRAKFFAVILTWAQLQSLVQGLDFDNTTENELQDSNRRILYGTVPDVKAFPFLVRLVKDSDLLCGGSIIADQWVITATHCLAGEDCQSIKINPAVWEYQKTVNVIECHMHPQYEPNLFNHDIGLLKVQGNLVGDGGTQTISLPDPGARFTGGTMASIAGWGQTEQGYYPSQLLFANVRVEDWESCNKDVKATIPGCQEELGCIVPDIPSRALCILGEGSHPSGSCPGDSGGPVIINGVLAGVFSHLITDANGKCRTGTPSIYTGVVDYLPWIYSFLTPGVDTSDIQM